MFKLGIFLCPIIDLVVVNRRYANSKSAIWWYQIGDMVNAL